MTLVEQLVTLVLVSVGLLGVAALQVSGLRAGNETFTRLRAHALAADILERIRANRPGFENGDYFVTFDETGRAGSTAELDLSTWQRAIDRALPGNSSENAGAIQRGPAPNTVTVVVRWGGSPSSAQAMPTIELHAEL
jgi:type IV pilus assembly protein PilV